MIYYFDVGMWDGAEMDKFLKAAENHEFIAFGFEPDGELYDSLVMKYADYDHVYIFPYAICGRSGWGPLYKSPNRQGNSIYKTKNNVTDEVETVQCEKLSNFIYSHCDPFIFSSFNILRFNMEGAELEMMKDLIDSDYIADFDLFLGAEPGADIKKVAEIADRYDEYMSLLNDYDIDILPFCDKMKSINIRDYLPDEDSDI